MALLAPLLFVLIWSGAFVAVRAGLPDATPLCFLAIRFTIAAGVLACVAPWSFRGWRPGWRQWCHLAVSGSLLNAFYLGAAYFAMIDIRAATMALIGAFHPIATALLSGPVLGERFRGRQWMGFASGSVGVALVAGVGAFDLGHPEGIAWAFASICCMILGTLYHARHCRDAPPVAANTIQLASAGVAAWILTALFETPHIVWTPTTVASLAYLTLGVSLGGMGLLLYMLRTGAAGKVAANFYLTPGVAALLGWIVLGEDLPGAMLPGFALTMLGVFLVRDRTGRGG